MWLSKVNVYCKYNVEREIVVVKKGKFVLPSSKKKKFFHQDLEYKESILNKFGGMFGLLEQHFGHERM